MTKENTRNGFWELLNHHQQSKWKENLELVSLQVTLNSLGENISKPCWRQNSSSKVELFRNQEKRGYSAVATVAASKPQSWLHQPLGIKVKRRWKTWKKIFFEKERKSKGSIFWSTMMVLMTLKEVSIGR